MFGESSTDKRDFRMGLAGLTAGIHSLRILAERGLASPEDIRVSQAGIMAVLNEIPEGEFGVAQRDQINQLLDNIGLAANAKFGLEE